MIDLHLHSTFSDGSFSPEALVELGAAAGLTAMTLTDHDSTRGVERFLAAAAAKGVRSVSGLEISVDVPNVTVHILAYGCDPANVPLNTALTLIRDGRHIRNVEILAKLSKLGCYLTPDEVFAFAGDKEVVARPHFARALIAKGYARNKQDAFDRYLAKGAPAYVDRYRLVPQEALRLIHQAGGVSVLAHPSLSGLTSTKLHAFVGELAGMGLDGIEAYYPGHSERQLSEYLGYATEFGLITTGGTDFHGEASQDLRLGVGYGSLRVPDELFDELLKRIRLAG